MYVCMYVVRHLETPLTVFVFKKKVVCTEPVIFLLLENSSIFFQNKTSMKYPATSLALILSVYGTERNPPRCLNGSSMSRPVKL